MYFKAYVTKTVESYEYNTRQEQFTDFFDPNTFQDLGLVDEFIKPTLKELKEEVISRYPTAILAELFDGALIFYTDIYKNNIPYRENFSISFTKIEESFLDMALIYIGGHE